MSKVIVVLIMGLFFWGVMSCSEYVEQVSKIEKDIKDKNKQYLKSYVLLEHDSNKKGFSDRINNWIELKIDKENQDVFKAFAARIKDCTESAENEKDFKEHEIDLMYYPFCIQGEKDLHLFEEFSQFVVYETEAQRKLLEMAKNRYSKNEKIRVPNESDINEFCGFKR